MERNPVLGTCLYIYKNNNKTNLLVSNQSATSTDTVSVAVTPNGTCGLFVTSHNPKSKVSLAKPITISGIVDNTNRQTLGCSWTMFEGQLGSVHVFAFVNNAWKSISKENPVPVSNWMTDKTTFLVEIGIDTGAMNIAEGTALKVVFTEENPAAINPSKTYELPLVVAYGELNDVPELMSLDVYIQDKEVARTSDCSVTKKITYQVPKTLAVADASLKILFEGELAKYGVYKSVSISNGVAKVILQSNMTTTGYPISSLSSCESGHLLSVLNDTLTQYKNIKYVEIFSPQGKIEF